MSAGRWSDHDSSQVDAWDRLHVWHPFTQMAEYEPFVIERADGCWLYDRDGNGYLDGVSSIWCNIHGHRHPRIDQAIREQLDEVAHITGLGVSNTVTTMLAKRLVDLAPPQLNRVFFAGDGSSAVEVALKMSYQYWQQREGSRPNKTKFLAFGDAYHGDTLGSASVGGIERFHQMFQPLLFETVRLPIPDSYRYPADALPESLADYYLRQLDEALAAHHDELAAVVIEPLVQCAAGMVMHPPGYLQGVRELTRQYEVHLIADEVAVGFGRTGKMFACEHEQVQPDFLCLAKGITGGYLAMSATLTTEAIQSAFLGSYASGKTFFHGHTYGGNQLAAAAAHATLDIFEEEETLAKVAALTEQLGTALKELSSHPMVGHARQRGLIAAVELVQDKETRQPFPWSDRMGQRVCDFALKQGVWLRPLGNVIVIMPPLAVNSGQLQQITSAVRAGIDSLLAT